MNWTKSNIYKKNNKVNSIPILDRLNNMTDNKEVLLNKTKLLSLLHTYGEYPEKVYF